MRYYSESLNRVYESPVSIYYLLVKSVYFLLKAFVN